MRLVPRAPKFEIRNLARFNQVVTAAFSQRRKQLGNSLRQLVSPAQFAQADIDPSLRAERLSAEAFARISNLLD